MPFNVAFLLESIWIFFSLEIYLCVIYKINPYTRDNLGIFIVTLYLSNHHKESLMQYLVDPIFPLYKTLVSNLHDFYILQKPKKLSGLFIEKFPTLYAWCKKCGSQFIVPRVAPYFLFSLFICFFLLALCIWILTYIFFYLPMTLLWPLINEWETWLNRLLPFRISEWDHCWSHIFLLY